MNFSHSNERLERNEFVIHYLFKILLAGKPFLIMTEHLNWHVNVLIRITFELDLLN